MDPVGTARAAVPDADFASFLAEVARDVAAHVEPWRVRVGDAIARWRREGIATAVLERALQLPAAPDVDGLLGTFEAAVARLRALEQDARRRDGALAGHPAFRDPARLAEAGALLARGRAPRAVPSIPSLVLDPETFVVEWPDPAALLVEAYG